MSTRPLPRGSQRRRAFGAVVVSLVGIGLLGGCAGSVFENRPDYARVNLAEGVTRACYHDPCSVTLTLPPGDGEYTVRANGRALGTYPAGQPVDLGAFSRQESPSPSPWTAWSEACPSSTCSRCISTDRPVDASRSPPAHRRHRPQQGRRRGRACP